MQLGLGVLRWPPDQFWSASMAELTAGIEGRNESITGERPKNKQDISNLRALFDRVPDVTPSIRNLEARKNGD